MGTDKDDVDEGFTSNSADAYGYFCSAKGKYSMSHVAKVLGGQKKAFKRNEIDLLNLKPIPELGWKYLKPEI